MVFRTTLFENGVVRLEFRANYTRLNNGVWGKGSTGALAVSESVVGSSPTWGTIVSWVAESMGLINHKISAIMPDDFVLSR